MPLVALQFSRMSLLLLLSAGSDPGSNFVFGRLGCRLTRLYTTARTFADESGWDSTCGKIAFGFGVAGTNSGRTTRRIASSGFNLTIMTEIRAKPYRSSKMIRRIVRSDGRSLLIRGGSSDAVHGRAKLRRCVMKGSIYPAAGLCGAILMSGNSGWSQATPPDPNSAMNEPDKIAWQLFIQVNSKAGAAGNNAMFETWASDTDTFTTNPQFPTSPAPLALRPPVIP